ncbi:hypothetical protein D7X30_36600 [Corallococcus sp. AB011P]|nr:hypothetical protein D7X30_36600 [Corallococcus sp. AB011P]
MTVPHIPEGMAYARLAGMPPQAALYSTPAALALDALFGSSSSRCPPACRCSPPPRRARWRSGARRASWRSRARGRCWRAC